MRSIVADFKVPLYDDVSPETRDVLSELKLEILLMLIECDDLINTLYIYKYLTSEEYCANTILYSEYYTTIKNSMVYRIVLGFSRLFDKNESTRTLRKITNCIEQNNVLREKENIIFLLEELRIIDEDAKSTYDFSTPRDQYFAHLDKKKIFSSLSVIKHITVIDELMKLLEDIIDKLVAICEIGFEEVPSIQHDKEIRIPDIRELNGFRQNAEGVLNKSEVIDKMLILTEDGLKFKERGI